jgi:hypothetical protein
MARTTSPVIIICYVIGRPKNMAVEEGTLIQISACFACAFYYRS